MADDAGRPLRWHHFVAPRASFRLDSYGRKRLWDENGSGRMLVFENIETKESRTVIAWRCDLSRSAAE